MLYNNPCQIHLPIFSAYHIALDYNYNVQPKLRCAHCTSLPSQRITYMVFLQLTQKLPTYMQQTLAILRLVCHVARHILLHKFVVNTFITGEYYAHTAFFIIPAKTTSTQFRLSVIRGLLCCLCKQKYDISSTKMCLSSTLLVVQPFLVM